ncbi:LysR family transcriptional regulator [Silicimonas algicola]|uniref:DNA-binding transcriptional LysR family regulator n=1 Tax=Silicimonas algicola TaxID=1826607 RepID=A0A316FXN3_9RHOB|nr:LysR family transcriptional regulator [Silicimonas algicola]AZQ66727.1 LysR family transcriptional regulator [Silicimonas algicola]PWK53163.1 DNA-binding transcriptional LysR family regulator [Silicimonas algicola]
MSSRHLMPLQYVDAIARAGSIRKAAETLAITSTALNRRLLTLENELGVDIFERLPRGVRLSTAGELLIAHIRGQLSDFEKLKSQIADLSGERRGHVSIACSQALLPYFLPEQISRYRRDHPAVTFGVSLRDRAAAEQSLVEMNTDIAIVFEPVRLREIQVLITTRQPLHAVMAKDHPLAGRETIRLRDCAAFPIGLPTAQYGVRHLIDLAMLRSSVDLHIAVESDSFEFLRHYPSRERLISFQIPVGLPVAGTGESIVSRKVDTRDVPEGLLYLCQLKGRTLPVAAAKFAAQVEAVLEHS